MEKSKIKTMIRKIVREEVALVIHEVITELREPVVAKNATIKQKKQYTKNTTLNEILNETAVNSDWETLGDGVYDSSKMGDIISSQYGDLMNGDGSNEVNADAMVASMGVNPNQVDDSVKDIFTKDYRSLMKKVDEKSKQTRDV